MTKKQIITDILKAYVHDVGEEGVTITKRRHWYVLRDQFAQADLSGIMHKGKQVQPITNANYNREFNDLAKNGEIDDTFISDGSRTVIIGERLPEIIIATEKDTITPIAENLAETLGLSLYVMGGFSSIYAAKELQEKIGKQTTILVLSDYDKSGFEIQNTLFEHFDNPIIHRVLLNADQVPESKKESWFGESKELGKWYELDILNIHQLKDVFLSNVPKDVAETIKEAYIEYREAEIMENEINKAIDEDERVIELREELDELESELYDEHESAFIEANPIVFDEFGISDIQNYGVEHKVNKWR